MRFVAIDTETTGFGHDAEIVELAAVAFDDDRIVAQWSTLINPGPINWSNPHVRKAMAINGISPHWLGSQPMFPSVAYEFLTFLARAKTWVAHNWEFDQRMLMQEFRSANLMHLFMAQHNVAKSVCTMRTAKSLLSLPKTPTLAQCCEHFSLVNDNKHRALSDAVVAGQLFFKLEQHRHRNQIELFPSSSSDG